MSERRHGFLEDYLPYLLRRADQALSAGFYRTLNDYGVARSEWRVLAVLADLGELSMLDLTAASLSPQPTVTHAVRRLEQRDLVRRVAGTHDKRQRFVSITASGRTLTKALIAEAKQLEAECLAGAGDLTELVDQLRRLTELVESAAQEAASEAG
ncbi:MAG: MarR family transcriptional regulator [Actinomycetota bacterium]